MPTLDALSSIVHCESKKVAKTGPSTVDRSSAGVNGAVEAVHVDFVYLLLPMSMQGITDSGAVDNTVPVQLDNENS